MNLTLCENYFNREKKKTSLPIQLENHDEIMERIAHWKEKAEDLDKRIRKLNTKGVSDKGAKDAILQSRHILVLERNYWKGKYDRFLMKEVPEGFSRRQGVDIGIISKYARLYLKSLFPQVYVVKGIVTSDFRKIWGLQEEYEKKERINHCHHAIDAVTIACIGPNEYAKLAQFHHEEENYRLGLSRKRASFPKPWDSFTEDVKQIGETLLVSHYTADNMGKPTRKRERKDGKPTGDYMQGDTARCSLHLDTYYGAIEREGKIKYVVRRLLDTLDQGDVKKIVDDVVRQKVQDAIAKYGSLKEAVKAGIWMNEEKGIRINKVRVFTPDVVSPLHIRKQRDKSPKEYKQAFHVKNDSNYLMGIYAGKDTKGKEKRAFALVNCLDAVRHYKSDASERLGELVPSVSANGLPLRWRIKTGTMVLLYEKTPEEVYKSNEQEWSRRLYKVVGLSTLKVSEYQYGTLVLVHHQEARPTTDAEAKPKNGCFKQGEALRPRIAMLHTQFNALVEGQDFTMNDIGEITFLNR